MEKTITILGEEVAITFCMAVEMKYEQITQQPFNLDDLKFKRNIMALYMAAILVAKPKTKITFDKLISKATREEIDALDDAVAKTMSEWLKIPKVIPVEEKPDDGDDQPKN